MKRIEKLIRDGNYEHFAPNDSFSFANVPLHPQHGAEKIINWFLEEIPEPYKLTNLEHELIKFWKSEGYEWITRDSDGGLFVYIDEPFKGDVEWYDNTSANLSSFKNLFTFVKWSNAEPTRLQDILDNCEVIDK